MRVLGAVSVSVAALLAACGGGGGGGGGEEQTLYVSLGYTSPTPISLYQPVWMVPQATGFNGHTPHCTLIDGGLPAGLSMQPDCTIVGRAMQEGMSQFTVRVGAHGATGTIDQTSLLEVRGPSVVYPVWGYPQSLRFGQGISDGPSIAGPWTPAPDLSLTWSYQMLSGTLPPGTSFDSVTGRIAGTAQAAGSYTVQIQATLNTQFGSYVVPMVSTYMANVDIPYVSYGATSSSPAVAYLSQPFSLAPLLFGGTTVSGVSFTPALPPGLVVDGQGVVSGVPTGVERAAQDHRLQATLHAGGVSVPTQGSLYLAVASPVRHRYVSHSGLVNVSLGMPYTLVPTVTQVSAVPLQAGATVAYAARPGCMAPGLSVDPATGVVSGTPSTPGVFTCYVDVSITNNGVGWTQAMALDLWVR